MNVTIVANRSVFEHALAAAKAPKVLQSDRELATVMEGALLGRVEAAWAEIERALRQAFQYGRAQAQSLIDAAVAKVDALVTEAGTRAREFQDALLRRMHEFVWRYVEGAVAQVPRNLKVGDAGYVLSTLRCTQKIVLGGALKTNLVELFELAAEGELEVSADYTLSSSQAGLTP